MIFSSDVKYDKYEKWVSGIEHGVVSSIKCQYIGQIIYPYFSKKNQLNII